MKKFSMRTKLIISAILGSATPWLYFLLAQAGAVRYLDNNGKFISYGASGVTGFIEFNGFMGALLIYMQAALICGSFVYLVCSCYGILKKMGK